MTEQPQVETPPEGTQQKKGRGRPKKYFTEAERKKALYRQQNEYVRRRFGRTRTCKRYDTDEERLEALRRQRKEATARFKERKKIKLQEEIDSN